MATSGSATPLDGGKLEVDDGDQADLRGFIANVTNESLLSGLSVIADDVTPEFAADAITNLGKGSNLNGGGTPCPCDLGVEIGSPGIGKDDIQSISFTLTHKTESLDVSLFDGEFFGIRATSVGDEKGKRKGSSKLVGIVPEPSTAVLMALGLVGLSAAGNRAKRYSA